MKTKAGCTINKTTKINQDSTCINPKILENINYYLFAVFDGHGINGHLISGILKKNFAVNLFRFLKTESSEDIKNALHSAYYTTNHEIYASQIDYNLSGSTGVAILIKNNRLFCANVGDSRAILVRNNKGQYIALEISIDQKPTLESEKLRIIKAGGRIERQKDQNHNPIGPYRIWLQNIDMPGLAMTRSFGDKIGAQAGVIAEPEIIEQELTDQDKFFVIASDGIWEYMSNEDVIKIIVPYYERGLIEQANEKLMSECINVWRKVMNNGYGFENLLKEGHKHLQGLQEVIMRNINACKEISKITRTSLGPNGMKKMVINHLEKLIVTSDAATIIKELEVQHPAAKMLVMASKMQENECGDGTNFVLTFAGELLNQAENLIKMGLHPSQIITGYEQALQKACQLLETLISLKVPDPRDKVLVQKAIKGSLSSKLGSYSDLFAKLITEACQISLPNDPQLFDIDFIRTAKILGSSVEHSFVMQGLLITRNAEGQITRVSNPKVAVYGTPLDPQQGETKGTVLLKNAKELLNYNKTEETHCQKLVQEIANAGINLIIAGGSISEMVLHFIELSKIMVVRITSKFDLKRICKAIGATPLARLGAPTPDEIGTCDECYVEEIGSQKVTIIKKEKTECKLSTIILRGSTNNLLEDIERAIDDGVNSFKNLIKEPNFVYGAGASEAILASKLASEAKSLDDLSQYSFNRFALAFEIIPRILAENAGQNSNEIMSKINNENQEQNQPHGISVEKQGIVKSSELDINDHLQTKIWALRLATDAAITVLKVDQIIIAKPSGGPKPPQKNTNWDED